MGGETKARGSKDRLGERARPETSEKGLVQTATDGRGFQRGEKGKTERTCRAKGRKGNLETRKSHHQKTPSDLFPSSRDPL